MLPKKSKSISTYKEHSSNKKKKLRLFADLNKQSHFLKDKKLF